MKRTITAIAVLLITSLLVSVPVCAQAKGGKAKTGGNTAGEKGTKAGNRQRKTLINGAEITVTPAIGLSVPGAPLKSILGGSSVSVSAGQFDIGLQVTMVGFPIKEKDDWLNNLTLILNMDIGVGGKMAVQAEGISFDVPITGGTLFQMSTLAGYKLEPKQNLYITPGIGLGYTSSAVSGTKDGTVIVFAGGTFDIPLYADLKYFFTDLIGIDVNIINSLGFGGIAATDSAFGSINAAGTFRNVFTLKVGPVFRF